MKIKRKGLSSSIGLAGDRAGSKLEVHLDRGQHQPGEEVDGRVRALADQRARGVDVRLVLVERSPDYVERPVVVPGGRIAQGDLAKGAEYPFSLSLPADAKPATTGSETRLGWEVEAEVDVPRWVDARASTPVAVASEGRRSDVPDPPGTERQRPRHRVSTLAEKAATSAAVVVFLGVTVAAIGALAGAMGESKPPWAWLLGVGGGAVLAVGALVALTFDIRLPVPTRAVTHGAIAGLARRVASMLPRRTPGIDLIVDKPTVRRGEELRWQLDATKRGAVSVGLVCIELRDVERRNHTSGRGPTTRVTRSARIHEEWMRGVNGIGDHGSLTIPAELPYSHLGRCASYAWFAVARRRRRIGHAQVDVPLVVEP